MLYIFILESIGTSELMLIGLVALIVFGPRKIPELARTIGKVMTEFRRSTDDFKKTWEREAGLEPGSGNVESRMNSFLGGAEKNETVIQTDQEIFSPEIKQLSKEDFDKKFPGEFAGKKIEVKADTTNKSDWL